MSILETTIIATNQNCNSCYCFIAYRSLSSFTSKER